METKRKIELLTIVLGTLTNDRYLRGICYNIEALWGDNKATIQEVNHLAGWFRGQKPRKKMNYSFAKNSEFYNGMWWWYCNEKGKEQRILFLKHLIKKLETLT